MNSIKYIKFYLIFIILLFSNLDTKSQSTGFVHDIQIGINVSALRDKILFDSVAVQPLFKQMSAHWAKTFSVEKNEQMNIFFDNPSGVGIDFLQPIVVRLSVVDSVFVGSLVINIENSLLFERAIERYSFVADKPMFADTLNPILNTENQLNKRFNASKPKIVRMDSLAYFVDVLGNRFWVWDKSHIVFFRLNALTNRADLPSVYANMVQKIIKNFTIWHQFPSKSIKNDVDIEINNKPLAALILKEYADVGKSSLGVFGRMLGSWNNGKKVLRNYYALEFGSDAVFFSGQELPFGRKISGDKKVIKRGVVAQKRDSLVSKSVLVSLLSSQLYPFCSVEDLANRRYLLSQKVVDALLVDSFEVVDFEVSDIKKSVYKSALDDKIGQKQSVEWLDMMQSIFVLKIGFMDKRSLKKVDIETIQRHLDQTTTQYKLFARRIDDQIVVTNVQNYKKPSSAHGLPRRGVLLVDLKQMSSGFGFVPALFGSSELVSRYFSFLNVANGFNRFDAGLYPSSTSGEHSLLSAVRFLSDLLVRR